MSLVARHFGAKEAQSGLQAQGFPGTSAFLNPRVPRGSQGEKERDITSPVISELSKVSPECGVPRFYRSCDSLEWIPDMPCAVPKACNIR
jgi:hypothetical protein